MFEMPGGYHMFSTQPFASVRRVGWPLILTFIILKIALSLLINLVIFEQGVFDGIASATDGLINVTLLANLLNLVVLVLLFLFVLARLRPADVGLLWRKLQEGIVFTLLLWALLQLVELVAGLLANGTVTFRNAWTNGNALLLIGLLLGQLFGNALVEEIEFRGFLLPQLFHKFTAQALQDRPWLRLSLAVLAMAVIFALMHIPNRIAMNESFGDLPLVLILGILFALYYLRTGNLWVAVGLHTLHNAPTMLLAPTLGYEVPLVVLELALLFLWPPLWQRIRSSDSRPEVAVSRRRAA